ncbi:MAG: hypothetical protein WKF75_21635 [Singulisphaera sp.]
MYDFDSDRLPRAAPCRGICVAAVALLSVHAGMLAWIGYRNSPILDEVAHLPAGISHWRFGTFDLYRVNPRSSGC